MLHSLLLILPPTDDLRDPQINNRSMTITIIEKKVNIENNASSSLMT